MITETQQFFIDVLKLFPVEETSVLLIQAPYEELDEIFKKISFKNDDIHQFVKFDRKNIELVLFETIYNDFVGYIQSIEIKVDDRKIFEGYDTMEYGMFSNKFNLPKEFKEKYTKMDMCMISEDW
ncbi:hypothetical protein [Joostella sp. CR20]|uniref:hypothetical protein n=1 Tax=Joostella sp. CR20 TaxID=2804312 RepID=UPI00313CE764